MILPSLKISAVTDIAFYILSNFMNMFITRNYFLFVDLVVVEVEDGGLKMCQFYGKFLSLDRFLSLSHLQLTEKFKGRYHTILYPKKI